MSALPRGFRGSGDRCSWRLGCLRGKGPAIAARFGARSYASYAELLAGETVDVAFAFGRHCEMPAIAEALIGRGIPFAIEKPCGTSADAINRIRRMADERGVYVAVPFIFRLSELLAGLSETEGEIPGAFHHVSFRFVAGSPNRYPAAGSPWMLDAEAAGGGCLSSWRQSSLTCSACSPVARSRAWPQ